jgi:cytochrome b pre-mRNA-processing protein 3
MLRFLFPRLTAEPERGAKLFAAVTDTARATHWYVKGQVPDALDGRFAMLATIAALVTVRLERSGDEACSIALTERFIEVMESEHRQLGLGDPKLGRTVRKLVGALARRVDLWGAAVGSGGWEVAARESVYGASEAPPDAVSHMAGQLREFWARLSAVHDAALAQGRLE